MKVLLVHRYFAPDTTTYAQMLQRFASYLGERGHSVTVLCGPPGYNGVVDGGDVPRVEDLPTHTIRRVRLIASEATWAKAVNSLLFPILVALHILTRRSPYQTVSVTTIPPVVMGVAGRTCCLRSRASRLIYHCMDLYPEVAEGLGAKSDGLLSRIACRIDSSTVSSAYRCLVLSSDMKRTLTRRGVSTDNVRVVNNFALSQAQVEHSGTGGNDRCSLVFAGNFGQFQGIETLVEAVKLANRRDCNAQLVFMGAGRLQDFLKSIAEADDSVVVLSHRPIDEAIIEIRRHRAAIVSLEPGVSRCAFPSKLMTYLEAGVEILAVVESRSDIAELVEENCVGQVAEPGDVESIARAIERMAKGQQALAPTEIQAVGRSMYDESVVLPQWAEHYGLANNA